LWFQILLAFGLRLLPLPFSLRFLFLLPAHTLEAGYINRHLHHPGKSFFDIPDEGYVSDTHPAFPRCFHNPFSVEIAVKPIFCISDMYRCSIKGI
jgi:hypothetical protein